MTPGIKPLVAGNWKMNGTSENLRELTAMTRGLSAGLDAECDALICVPATLISRAAQMMSSSNIRIGGQDCHPLVSGAHTGDTSAEMIKDAGATHVIVGHSERRTDHYEGDAMVAAKAKAAWRAGLTAIICIGETEDQRTSGQTLDVLSRQIESSIPSEAVPENTIIAYEPVWAIGTGLTPTSDDVEDAHAHIRERLIDLLGDGARKMRILYGGSVKPSNAKELMAIANVDGALVGGASLKSADFLGIADAYLSM